MHLQVSEGALEKIAESGFDPVFGARPLKRAIQLMIENPLSKRILEGEFAAEDTILLDREGDELVFKKKA